MCVVIGAGGDMGGRVSVLSYLGEVDGQAQVGSAECDHRHCIDMCLIKCILTVSGMLSPWS